MRTLDRITFTPDVMEGKACIRGMRVTVGMIVESMLAGATVAEMLDAYPYLEREDILQAMEFSGHPLPKPETQPTAA